MEVRPAGVLSLGDMLKVNCQLIENLNAHWSMADLTPLVFLILRQCLPS